MYVETAQRLSEYVRLLRTRRGRAEMGMQAVTGTEAFCGGRGKGRLPQRKPLVGQAAVLRSEAWLSDLYRCCLCCAVCLP